MNETDKEKIHRLERENEDRRTYDDAIQVAASLIEPENYEPLAENGGNPEYVRAQVELICDLFGYQRYGLEPRETVEQDLRKAVMREGETALDANPEIREALEAIWREFLRNLLRMKP